ncbi:hypothetical protein DTO003C3_10316 [Penicillium roqueforti]|nr:hypothetical protein DTO003C3_10316 [Penicillium roqueforti]
MPPDGLDDQFSVGNRPRNTQRRPVESSPERNLSRDRQPSMISRRSHYSTGRTPPRRYVTRAREPPEFELAIRHLKRAKESVRKLKDDGKFEPLKGKANYRHWADNMEQLFDDNAVTAIVYGEIMILPREHRHQMLQAQYVSFARKAINAHISKPIQQYLQDRGLRNPAEMWKTLRTSYAPSNASVASDGVDDIAALRISDCASFDQFKFRFQTAWTKIFSNGRNEDERFKCLLFLRFIDTDKWSNWKINFKSRVSASSNPDEIYQFEKLTGELEDVDKTLNEERRSTAYTTKTGNARGKSDKIKQKCEHCNKPGHKKEDCYLLYPEKKPKRDKVTDSYVTKVTTLPQAAIQAFATETSMPPIDHWVCDTASDDHMISSPHYFIPGSVSPITTRISTATSDRSVNGLTGDVVLVLASSPSTKGQEARMKLTRVMWYPSLRINLLSGDKLAKHGVTALFEPKLLTFIRKDRSVLGTGRKSGKQWLLNVKSIEPQSLSQSEDRQCRIGEFVTPHQINAPDTNPTIGGIQSDNGGEFVYHKLQDWAKMRGIPWYFIAPYAHEQNGKIERLMRIVGERMRCLLADSKLPQFLWAEIMKTVVMVRNMTFYNGRKLAEREPTTPYEMRYGRKPDLSFLRIIGSKVWKLFPKEAIQRSPEGRHLAHRAELGFLTGYSSYNGSQYRVYRPFQNPAKSGGTMHTVRDAIIDEGPDWDLYNNPDFPVPTCSQQGEQQQETPQIAIEYSDHENSDKVRGPSPGNDNPVY